MAHSNLTVPAKNARAHDQSRIAHFDLRSDVGLRGNQVRRFEGPKIGRRTVILDAELRDWLASLPMREIA